MCACVCVDAVAPLLFGCARVGHVMATFMCGGYFRHAWASGKSLCGLFASDQDVHV